MTFDEPSPQSQSTQWTIECDGEAATDDLGQSLAAALQPGIVIALNGNLGAGKTRFVQAVATALGVDREQVGSPTFVLIKEYFSSPPIYHFDTYRLRDGDEFLELGAGELMESEGVCFIEWADRVEELLPADRLRIDITATAAPAARSFQITATGPQSQQILSDWQQRHAS